MMKFIKLEREKQFKALKEGSLLLVKWKEREGWTNDMDGIMLYKMVKNVSGHPHDIICRTKGNHYFNYMMHLKGDSIAEEVYRVDEK